MENYKQPNWSISIFSLRFSDSKRGSSFGVTLNRIARSIETNLTSTRQNCRYQDNHKFRFNTKSTGIFECAPAHDRVRMCVCVQRAFDFGFGKCTNIAKKMEIQKIYW